MQQTIIKSSKGLRDKEVKERLRDIIVYSLIAIAMDEELRR